MWNQEAPAEEAEGVLHSPVVTFQPPKPCFIRQLTKFYQIIL